MAAMCTYNTAIGDKMMNAHDACAVESRRRRTLVSESLGGLNAAQGLSSGTSLLLQPAHNGVGGSATGVFNSLAVSEEFQSGIATDFKLLSEGRVDGSINLTQQDGRLFVSQLLGSLSVL